MSPYRAGFQRQRLCYLVHFPKARCLRLSLVVEAQHRLIPWRNLKLARIAQCRFLPERRCWLAAEQLEDSVQLRLILPAILLQKRLAEEAQASIAYRLCSCFPSY